MKTRFFVQLSLAFLLVFVQQDVLGAAQASNVAQSQRNMVATVSPASLASPPIFKRVSLLDFILRLN